MASPIPNPNSRRSTTRSSSRFDVLPAEGRRGAAPPLPTDVLWEPAVIEAWERWWESPMATRWQDADVDQLIVAARMLQKALAGGVNAATEFRLLADRFGLNPQGRLRNRWRVEGEPGAFRATFDGPDADVVPLRVREFRNDPA